MNIPDSRRFLNTEWRLVTRELPSSSFHALFRSSGHPIAFGMRGSLDQEFALAMIRFIDLPATRRGATDIFDLSPVMSNNDQRLRWVHETCRKIQEGAEAHHGVALSALARKGYSTTRQD